MAVSSIFSDFVTASSLNFHDLTSFVISRTKYANRLTFLVILESGALDQSE